MFKVALIQMNTQDNIRDNLKTASDMIIECTDNKADIILLPENFLYIGKHKKVSFKLDSFEIKTIAKLAADTSTYILAGSIPEKVEIGEKNYNTSLFINNKGDFIGIYRKMHLFDVGLGDSPEFNESSYVVAGDQPVLIKTDFGSIGMTICYDLRFPELYRNLALMGCNIAFVPSNFAMHTGKDHWQVLLRARAIENGMFIIAPNQFGSKYDGNSSYGHSAVIDPWGTVIAQASDTAPAIVYAQIDLDLVRSVRKKIPSLKHVKLFNIGHPK